ncbi:putative secreted protein [Wickerhamomyces ciferrii]|uniref:Secreted protein n=1 Tax=Wickerhamomyces ciferrii (strain ATCC 14091 / BCRC 22168 / CBS 111 / JCM 3599 / NBRC 0793 / NRRL Y-1031 F-60-10) TaxID=1206466 RepID=K0KMN6_WICCF|nr:uncharacterized protein BN7_6138 [Wickerhamomyces ciferrii]CCH46545.1 putative secreted protein [Wickerhamomyces ciferrii]
MKLSTIFTPALLLSGVMASPIASSDSNNNDTSTIDTQGFKTPYLCYGAGQNPYCRDGSYRKCTEFFRDHTDYDSIYGGKFCGFWCNEIKNSNDCKNLKKLYDFHPKFACDNAQYC